MIHYRKHIIFSLLLVLFVIPLSAQPETEKQQPPPLTRILFVFDASQSMFGRWQSDMKINIAQRLLSSLLDSLRDVRNMELALRVYGHQKTFPPQDCDDSRLEVPFGPDNFRKIQHALKVIVPKGTTPIAYSLSLAANDFPPCDRCRNIIILITDGLEECGGDPCAVSRDLQKRGVVLKPFIIGIGRDFKQEFDCVGTYFDASSEQAFSKALNVAISQALNSTTAQVNLLDAHGNATETNVNMTFYDHLSGLVKYNYVHTMNPKGLPDTLVIDPLVVYDVEVQTIPPVRKDSVHLTAGQHTVIPVMTPRGDLIIKMESTQRQSRDLRCLIRRAGDGTTLHVQQLNRAERYITGVYDIEVLTLPRTIIPGVEITQSRTTTVEIPGPGIAVIQKSAHGYGSLYVEQNNKLEWIYNLGEDPAQESLLLQPGRYRVVFRGKYAKSSLNTIEKRFTITSGTTTNVKIFE